MPHARRSSLEQATKAYHDGYTPVHASIIGRSTRCLKLLLDANLDPNARNRFQQTPLHLAARLGDEEALLLLLEAAADSEAKDERGMTPRQARMEGLAPRLNRMVLGMSEGRY